MNQTAVAILAGFIAGVVGGYFGQSLAGNAKGANADMETLDMSALREEIDDLEHDLRVLRNPPETLAAGASGPIRAETDAEGLRLTAEAEQALLTRVDERVAAAVDKKIDELQAEGVRVGAGRAPGKKKMTLAEAAVELELSGQQEDELRRIYEDSERRMLALLAGPDGDSEEVKREIQDAAKSPAGAGKIIGKYAPKLIANLGEVMTIQAEKEAAIAKTLGPEKTKQLESGYEVAEGSFLGLGGGGGRMNFGASVEVDDR